MEESTLYDFISREFEWGTTPDFLTIDGKEINTRELKGVDEWRCFIDTNGNEWEAEESVTCDGDDWTHSYTVCQIFLNDRCIYRNEP